MTPALPPIDAPEPTPRFDRFGHPWSEYVRTIDLLDPDPVAADEAPVHVLRRTLFDGVIAPCQIAKEGVTVDLSGDGGTVVTLWVHRDDVQIGGVDEDGEARPWLLGGRRVLTPTGEGWDWVPVDEDDPDNPWVAVSLFVAEVHIR